MVSQSTFNLLCVCLKTELDIVKIGVIILCIMQCKSSSLVRLVMYVPMLELTKYLNTGTLIPENLQAFNVKQTSLVPHYSIYDFAYYPTTNNTYSSNESDQIIYLLSQNNDTVYFLTNIGNTLISVSVYIVISLILCLIIKASCFEVQIAFNEDEDSNAINGQQKNYNQSINNTMHTDLETTSKHQQMRLNQNISSILEQNAQEPAFLIHMQPSITKTCKGYNDYSSNRIVNLIMICLLRIPIVIILMFSPQFCYFAFVQMRFADFQDTFQKISFAIAIIISIILGALLIKMIFICKCENALLQARNNIQINTYKKNYSIGWACLIRLSYDSISSDDYRLESQACIYYKFVDLLRIPVALFFQVYTFEAMPVMFTTIILAMFVTLFFYLVLSRPFLKTSEFVIQLIRDLIFIAIYACLTVVSSTSANNSDALYNLALSLLILYFAYASFALAVILCLFFKQCLLLCRLSSTTQIKMRQIKPLQPNYFLNNKQANVTAENEKISQLFTLSSDRANYGYNVNIIQPKQSMELANRSAQLQFTDLILENASDKYIKIDKHFKYFDKRFKK